MSTPISLIIHDDKNDSYNIKRVLCFVPRGAEKHWGLEYWRLNDVKYTHVN